MYEKSLQQWLEIEETTGTVLYAAAHVTGQAVLGTRLQAVGDRIQTQKESGRDRASLHIPPHPTQKLT